VPGGTETVPPSLFKLLGITPAGPPPWLAAVIGLTLSAAAIAAAWRRDLSATGLFFAASIYIGACAVDWLPGRTKR
jgi:hypothetical protein